MNACTSMTWQYERMHLQVSICCQRCRHINGTCTFSTTRSRSRCVLWRVTLLFLFFCFFLCPFDKRIHQVGLWNSFERELYDMIRAAFIKYSSQCRIGRSSPSVSLCVCVSMCRCLYVSVALCVCGTGCAHACARRSRVHTRAHACTRVHTHTTYVYSCACSRMDGRGVRDIPQRMMM